MNCVCVTGAGQGQAAHDGCPAVAERRAAVPQQQRYRGDGNSGLHQPGQHCLDAQCPARQSCSCLRCILDLLLRCSEHGLVLFSLGSGFTGPVSEHGFVLF